MTFRMSDLSEATRGVNPAAAVSVSIDGGAPVPAIGIACTSADVMVCAGDPARASARTLYRVQCPEYTEAVLLVISDSPEGAASFMQLRLRDMRSDDPEFAAERFDGSYLVRRVAADVGDGIWLSGYDRAHDHESVLRTEVPDWDKANPYCLWGVELAVRLGTP